MNKELSVVLLAIGFSALVGCSAAGVVASLACAGSVLADVAVNDPLYIAGDYKCTGFDSHDGAFKGDIDDGLVGRGFGGRDAVVGE